MRFRATFHALNLFYCDRTFYPRTHVKITRHWKSTLKVPIERNRGEVTLRKKDDVKINWNVSFVKKHREKPSENANINKDIQAGVQGQGVDQEEGSTEEQKYRNRASSVALLQQIPSPIPVRQTVTPSSVTLRPSPRATQRLDFLND